MNVKEYSVKITANDPELYECLYNEQGKGNRSSSSVKIKDKKVIIDVKAKDATALRAEVNGYMRFLVVYEKIISVIQNN